MNKVIPAVKILTIILVVLFLLLTSVRILLSPLFLRLEYKTPWFPEDTYGFTKQERYQWARLSLDYLLNQEGIDFLEREKLPSGDPLYNERELQHMADVKNLISKALITWYIIIALLILLGLFASEANFKSVFWEAFSTGGLVTILLIVLIIIGVLTSFNQLFTGFHLIFFEGDTWLFNYSDTLIRLFPMRFWQDAFISMGILSVLGGIIVFVIGRKVRNKCLTNEANPRQK